MHLPTTLRSTLALSAVTITVAALAYAAPGLVGNPGPVTWTLEQGSELKIGSQPAVSLGVSPPSSFSGAVDASGNVVLPASSMVLEAIPVSAVGMQFDVRLEPLADAAGTVDPASGKVTVHGRFRVRISGGLVSSSCEVPEVEVHLTSEHPLGTPYDAATGRATLVDDTFYVPAAERCGFFVTGTMNRQLGLPAAPGQSSLKLVVFATPLVVAPPSPAEDAGTD